MSLIDYYDIKPIPKPRMTQRDRWSKRPCVLRYHAFKDRCRELEINYNNGDHVLFIMPMAESWSKKKKEEKVGTLHDQRPDKDNLEKALMDALLDEDCEIADTRVTKIWGYKGSIVIKRKVYEWNKKLSLEMMKELNVKSGEI